MKDGMESLAKVGAQWIPLDAYRIHKAEKLIEGIRAIAFLGIVIFVAAVLLWGLP
jgi:hypothetical protein